MEEGFEPLRCPMCGGEIVYSEGTHDLCCGNNPYEGMSDEEWEAAAALREGRAEYGADEPGGGHIYVAGISAGERDKGNPFAAPVKGRFTSEAAGRRGDSEGCAGDADNVSASDAPVIGRAKVIGARNRAAELSAGERDEATPSAAIVKSHACVFAVTFTESGRFGTLWSVRVVHGETNYFSLMRLMQKIEKRQRSGEPLAANAPNPPKKRERSQAAKLAFRYGIEEEDIYSIRFSSETVPRLAVFYGISERDIRQIKQAEVENNSDNRLDE